MYLLMNKENNKKIEKNLGVSFIRKNKSSEHECEQSQIIF